VDRALADSARDAFDQRQKTQVFRADGGKKTVHLQGEHDVVVIDYAENIDRYAMFDKAVIAAHHRVVGAQAPSGAAVQIMDFLRAVKAQAYGKAMFCQKAAPGIVQQGAVGLDAVGNAFVGRAIFLLQFDNAPEVVKTKERRLAAVPGKSDNFSWMGLNMPVNIGFKKSVRHQRQWVCRQEVGLAEIIAIAALEVATIAGRFGKDLKIAGCCCHIG